MENCSCVKPCGCSTPPTLIFPQDLEDWIDDSYRLNEFEFLDKWEKAHANIPRPVDPLILDLNRDGKLELHNAAFFDLNANGFHEYTRWISETDAFLVLDKNADALINNGGEMFGDAMILPDGSRALAGFDALRAYDSNEDGKIDANDEIYSSLNVLTGAGEIASLANAGIQSIKLPPLSVDLSNTTPGGTNNGGGTNSSSLSGPWASLTFEERTQALIDRAHAADQALWEAGGAVNFEGAYFEWEDGTKGTIAEAFPYRVPMLSIPDEYLEVPEDIAALPDIMGMATCTTFNKLSYATKAENCVDYWSSTWPKKNKLYASRFFRP
jgi:hypothetical protein